MLLWLLKAYTMLTRRCWQFFVSLLLAALVGPAAAPALDSFRFVTRGDRTGEAQPGVYERVWQQAAAETPAFVLSIGDTIQGLNDETAESEWRHVQQILAPFRGIPLYLAAGN